MPMMSSKPKPYDLMVLTRPATGWTAGHAMIGIGTSGCTGPNCCIGIWGFYPEGVVDETTRENLHHYNRSVVLNITDRQRQLVEAEIDRWRNESYILGIRDCTDFVVAVLAAAGAIVNDQLWPDDLGENLERKFGIRWGACPLRDAL